MVSPRRRSARRVALLVALALGGCLHPTTTATAPAPPALEPSRDVATVRYQVRDVDRALAFYTQRLGFQLEKQTGTVFAVVSRGDLRLLLSGPGSSGSRPLPDGRRQEPGGSNRIVLYVDDLASYVRTLETTGVRLRGGVEVGPGGKLVQIEDPDGNPIELHETTEPEPPPLPGGRRRTYR